MKSTDVLTAARIQETAIDADGRVDADLAGRVREVLDDQGIALIHGFPREPDAYVAFLRTFGEPFENYSASGKMHDDEPHPVLNRVKYRAPETRQSSSVHYIDGSLTPHSARAWTDPRPAFFSMYMVDAGWRDLPAGQNGESIFVRWHDLFKNEAADQDFQSHLKILTESPLVFRSKNVEEAISELPLVYPLSDAQDEFDHGVRMKQDLLAVLGDNKGGSEIGPEYLAAAEALVAAAARSTNQIQFNMETGDVVIVDNDRVSHGRTGMVGESEIDGERALNPREIWSTTLR
ncbi:TauD/TfdA family dioxygenase [Actinoplanes sp. L3-i22]|uniref:TauD/TfdA family dioxygenase n=1 Tax=Actinoplanes sp. L3-i22 TaxID=2836373 RepID=UPI001C859786|nr:TauD/TfdA family dioxygenase [Actinoplanes sp. L3-i22]